MPPRCEPGSSIAGAAIRFSGTGTDHGRTPTRADRVFDRLPLRTLYYKVSARGKAPGGSSRSLLLETRSPSKTTSAATCVPHDGLEALAAGAPAGERARLPLRVSGRWCDHERPLVNAVVRPTRNTITTRTRATTRTTDPDDRDYFPISGTCEWCALKGADD